MADTKISGLAPVTDVQDGDEYAVARAGATKKITGANLKAAMPGGVTGSRTLTAGAGLAGGGDLSADRAFSVNVDGATIEISADTLRLKDGGVTAAKVASDVATQAELDAHTADTTNAHAASAIGFTPVGTIAATDVQAAIAEVATDAAAGGGIAATIVDAKGDLIAASAADTVARLPVGSNNQVLTADSGQTLGVKWATPAAAGAVATDAIWDTKGDLAVASAADTAAKLPVGSNNQVLTADSGQTLGVKWAAPVGGTLDGLSNVNVPSPADEDVLTWDVGAGNWVAKASAAVGEKTVEIKVIDDATVLTTGDGKVIICVPAAMNGMNLVAAHAFVTTVSSSGLPTVQIRNVTGAADMLTTKISIDASEFTSYTAATAPVVDTAHDDVSTGNLLAVDVDVAGTGAKGLGVILTFS